MAATREHLLPGRKETPYALTALSSFDKVVDVVDVPLFVKQMADQAEYTNTVIREKFGKTLPKNKICDWA